MINYLEHDITAHCNLRCRGCSHFSPLANEWFEDFDQFYEDFSKLRDITNGDVRIIRIMGGEPLLHPQVKLILITTRLLFPKSIIQLVTNGILIDKIANIKEVCNQYGIVVCISNYGLGMKPEGINWLIYDNNKSDMYNLSLDITGSQDSDYAFKHCDHRKMQCNFFQNGRFYPCAMSAKIDIFNSYFGTNIKGENGFSVYEHTEEEIKEYLSKPIDTCKYCDVDSREKSLAPFSCSKKQIEEWVVGDNNE